MEPIIRARLLWEDQDLAAPVDVERVARRVGLDVRPCQLSLGFMGEVHCDEWDDWVMVLNANMDDALRRWIAAQGLGHYLLHRNHADVFVLKDWAVFPYSPLMGVDKRLIHEAFVFAQELLMPAKKVQSLLQEKRSPDFIAGVFYVPPTLAKGWIRDLGLTGTQS